MSLLTDPQDDSEENNGQENVEIAIVGTVWKKIETGFSTGRVPVHTVFKDVSGPARYAEKNIKKSRVSIAFCLLLP